MPRYLNDLPRLSSFVLAAMSLIPVAAPAMAQRVVLPNGAMAYLPSSFRGKPLVVVLHGAGQNPETMIERLTGEADALGVPLLMPKSKGPTWDIVRRLQMDGLLGATRVGDAPRYSGSPDGRVVTAAVAELERATGSIWPSRLLLGFSDGATFALGFGTGRDRPFQAIVAVAPGMGVVATRVARGRRALVMHGRRDRVLSFEQTQSSIVPMLRRVGLKVEFHPFDGAHALPQRILSDALAILPPAD